jgi:hypothetical protein
MQGPQTKRFYKTLRESVDGILGTVHLNGERSLFSLNYN